MEKCIMCVRQNLTIITHKELQHISKEKEVSNKIMLTDDLEKKK